MMGEFIIYYCGKIVGGIYDDRLLVKPVKSAVDYMTTISYELPYDGAKEMLLVDNIFTNFKKFIDSKGLVRLKFGKLSYRFLNASIF